MARDALGELYTEKRGNRVVAVRRLTVAPDAIEGILADVGAAMKLSSPEILKPIDASADGGRVTIVSETIEGRTLRGLLTTLASNGEKLAVSQATWIMIQVLGTLEQAQAHTDGQVRAPIFHGRLSPEHVVLLPSGQVRVTGFGLDVACRHLLKPESKTDTTFAYVAPEQHVSGELNETSDNFAVAAMLAEAVLGKPLFVEDTFGATWEAIANRLPPLLREAREGVPKALDEAVMWALEKNVNRRCPRPDALRSRLEAFQGVLDVGDRIKPGEHARRLSDLLRLRMKGPMTEAAVDITSMEPTHAAAPEVKRSRGKLRVLKLVFALLVAFFAVGVWAKWPELEEPVRRRIPPAVAAKLGIEPPGPAEPVLAAVAPVAVDAGEVAADAGQPADAGSAVQPARVSIESTPPKAVVTLDGKPLGTTPLVDAAVAPGEHTLELVTTKPSRRLVQKLVVREGETKKLRLKLKSK